MLNDEKLEAGSPCPDCTWLLERDRRGELICGCGWIDEQFAGEIAKKQAKSGIKRLPGRVPTVREENMGGDMVSRFAVEGSRGDEYVVEVFESGGTGTPQNETCTCPAFKYRKVDTCKHIDAVYVAGFLGSDSSG